MLPDPPDLLAKLLKRPVAIFGAGVSGQGVRSLLDALGTTGRIYDENGAGEDANFSPLQASQHNLVVFSPGYLEPPFAYYLRHDLTPPLTRGFPVDDLVVHQPPATWNAESVANGARRIWLIEASAHPPQSPDLADALTATGAPTWQRAWTGVTVRRFDR